MIIQGNNSNSKIIIKENIIINIEKKFQNTFVPFSLSIQEKNIKINEIETINKIEYYLYIKYIGRI